MTQYKKPEIEAIASMTAEQIFAKKSGNSNNGRFGSGNSNSNNGGVGHGTWQNGGDNNHGNVSVGGSGGNNGNKANNGKHGKK